MKTFSNSLYTTTNPLKLNYYTPNALDLMLDLLQSRPTNTGENQPITNFKPQIYANTTVNSNKSRGVYSRCVLHTLWNWTWHNIIQIAWWR